MGGSSNTTTTTTSGGGGGIAGKDKDKGKDSPAAFMEGDRVLAYHGPLLYEAKVPLPFPSPTPLAAGLGFASAVSICSLFPLV